LALMGIVISAVSWIILGVQLIIINHQSAFNPSG
jgi:hypothetical protein